MNSRQETGKAELIDLVAQEARLKNIFQNASNNKDSVKRRLKRANEEGVLAEKQIVHLEKNESETHESLASIRDEIRKLQGQIDTTKSKQIGRASCRERV